MVCGKRDDNFGIVQFIPYWRDRQEGSAARVGNWPGRKAHSRGDRRSGRSKPRPTSICRSERQMAELELLDVDAAVAGIDF